MEVILLISRSPSCSQLLVMPSSNWVFSLLAILFLHQLGLCGLNCFSLERECDWSHDESWDSQGECIQQWMDRVWWEMTPSW